jgi:hypothetical protein
MSGQFEYKRIYNKLMPLYPFSTNILFSSTHSQLPTELPDFSWYKIPKWENIYVPNGHEIYQNATNYIKWP